MDYRIEHDSMGEVKVESDKLWGAQTERSKQNFKIGAQNEIMPDEIIHAFGILKLACAKANKELKPDKMTDKKLYAIETVCNEIIEGKLKEHFPLAVFQTGSGTQSNMNVNEVIANRANMLLGEMLIHPNDDVNMSQSSNDTFPSAMHIASVIAIKTKLLPNLCTLIEILKQKEEENKDVVKIGRTHLQDATPLRFSDEISGWRASLERNFEMINTAADKLLYLALGGTAVGTGINAPKGFDKLSAEKIAQITGFDFVTDPNKFHSLTSKAELVFAHGALKALAADLWKIANDVRLLSSGPRCGIGEIFIPENEPGSSIMPGKVNPTQCEALTMVAAQIMGNDTVIGLAASQGNFELNVFMPVCAYNFLQSARLLSDAILSFALNCARGIRANKAKMQENLNNSLMLVTALNTHIGYENAARVAKTAYSENITLKQAALKLKLLSEEEFDAAVNIENMI